MKQIYLDYNATTPLLEEVVDAMLPFLESSFGNPSSVHSFGRPAREAIENARELFAKMINADTSEIVFTSCGSESNNLALKGILYLTDEKTKKGHVITSTIEHPSILETCSHLESIGYPVTWLKVDGNGRISIEELEKSITDRTSLISIMYGNNEIGAIQDIPAIGAAAKKKGVVFHTDAVQVLGKVPVDVKKNNIDLLSVSAHKLYAPKGIGAIYIRKGLKMEALIHGGHQELSRRAGTENVAGIVAFGKACEIAMRDMEAENRHLSKVKEKLKNGLITKIPKIRFNSPESNCLPTTLNVGFLGVEGESILINLDLKGVAVSTGSACSSGSVEPSHVLVAIGTPVEYSQSSLRFSFGRFTKEEDIDYVLEILPPIVEKLRSMSPIWNG
ncbi:MAG: cysteine desulfurase NifS [Candidatus Schekmanbacteria bacterium]|nr:cysteine desulfurase NifS [Candidatus Schekmanbacteria bacterium]